MSLQMFYQKLRTFIPLWIWREAFLFPLRGEHIAYDFRSEPVTGCVTL